MIETPLFRILREETELPWVEFGDDLLQFVRNRGMSQQARIRSLCGACRYMSAGI